MDLCQVKKAVLQILGLARLISVIAIIFLSSCKPVVNGGISTSLIGVVVNEKGPIEGAVVRFQGTNIYTTSDGQGKFKFEDVKIGNQQVVTAWSEGHYIGWLEVTPNNQPLTIQLSKYSTADNLDYDWQPGENGLGSIGCAECHPAYSEWFSDAHSQSAQNPRFLTMYTGTDTAGNQSPLTQYGFNPEYGNFPLRPQEGVPYYGPGYKLDFPTGAGTCAACHVPAQAAYPGAAYTSDPTLAEGMETEGIFCDFCHKIGAVTLDPASGLPPQNMPGVLSIQLFRPANDGEDLFLGNFDDVAGPDSYLPLYEDSAFCAPCHFGEFWDIEVYNSYGEWLASPYSDPDTGQTCQDCHMPAVDYEFFVYPEKGGIRRDPAQIRDHNMTAHLEEVLMQEALSLDAAAKLNGSQLRLDVVVVNDLTGHAVPTDYPLRQVILVIDAVDENGARLEQIGGEKIPFYGGGGDQQELDFAGLPGKIYMKVLQEIWTEFYPSGAYWNPTRVLDDTRLFPFDSDRNSFTFALDDSQTAEIRVRLLFRRAPAELMSQKGWNVPDILMEEILLEVGR